MPRVPVSHITERDGVALVEHRVAGRLRWLFREQVVSDVGIDGHIEVVRDDRATGRLLGVQIKSGASYFDEEADDGFVFRGETSHLDYWQNHSLPVIVVLCDPTTDRCYWQVLNEDTVEETGKGWKVVVPKGQPLDDTAARRLSQLAQGRPYDLRLRRLQVDKAFMEELAKGHRLVLKITEWINKSSGRGDFELVAEDSSGEERMLEEWTWLLAGWDYAEVLPNLFPWADLINDEALYDQYDEEAWTESCGIWDSEDKCYIMHTMTLQEWRERLPEGLRPYSEDGEIAAWQLELGLNGIGRSFLVLEDYLASGEAG